MSHAAPNREDQLPTRRSDRDDIPATIFAEALPREDLEDIPGTIMVPIQHQDLAGTDAADKAGGIARGMWRQLKGQLEGFREKQKIREDLRQLESEIAARKAEEERTAEALGRVYLAIAGENDLPPGRAREPLLALTEEESELLAKKSSVDDEMDALETAYCRDLEIHDDLTAPVLAAESEAHRTLESAMVEKDRTASSLDAALSPTGDTLAALADAIQDALETAPQAADSHRESRLELAVMLEQGARVVRDSIDREVAEVAIDAAALVGVEKARLALTEAKRAADASRAEREAGERAHIEECRKREEAISWLGTAIQGIAARRAALHTTLGRDLLDARTMPRRDITEWSPARAARNHLRECRQAIHSLQERLTAITGR